MSTPTIAEELGLIEACAARLARRRYDCHDDDTSELALLVARLAGLVRTQMEEAA